MNRLKCRQLMMVSLTKREFDLLVMFMKNHHLVLTRDMLLDQVWGYDSLVASIWIFRRKEGAVWLTLAACIAFSRVWTGVHYPSDVLAGALLGTAAAVAVHRLFSRVPKAKNILNRVIQWYEVVECKIWRIKILSK